MSRGPQVTKALFLPFTLLVGCGGGSGVALDMHTVIDRDASLAIADALSIPDATPIVDPSFAPEWAHHSGSRIQVFVLRTADGYEEPKRLHDSQLDVDCFLQTLSDGKTRCAPGAVTGSKFSDPECKKRSLASAGAFCGQLVRAFVDETGRRDVYRWSALDPMAPVYETAPNPLGGSPLCMQAAPDGISYVAPTELIPPENFVEFSDSMPESISSRVSPLVRAGADGTVVQSGASAGLFDNTLRIPCRLDWAADGVARCLPQVVVPIMDIPVYSDEKCREELIATPSASNEPAFAATAIGGCYSGAVGADVALWTMYRQGARHSGPIFKVGSNGICTAATPDPTLSYSVRQEIHPTELQRFDLVVGKGTRVRRPLYRGGGTWARGINSPLQDVTLGLPCAFWNTDPGYRCLPHELLGFGPRYRDSECKSPAVSVGFDTPGCGLGFITAPSPAPYYGTQVSGSSCSVVPSVYELGQILGSVFVLDARGVCRRSDEIQSYYAPGRPVDLDTFAAADEVIR